MDRHILIDVQGYGIGEDLFLTNAPDGVIKAVSNEIRFLKSADIPAEEIFITKILKMGFTLQFITNIKDATVFTVSNENF